MKAQDRHDMRLLMELFGPALARCKGGRLIANGYTCPHCRSRDPQAECNGYRRKEEPPATQDTESTE